MKKNRPPEEEVRGLRQQLGDVMHEYEVYKRRVEHGKKCALTALAEGRTFKAAGILSALGSKPFDSWEPEGDLGDRDRVFVADRIENAVADAIARNLAHKQTLIVRDVLRALARIGDTEPGGVEGKKEAGAEPAPREAKEGAGEP